jgi:hypothetical protein
MDATNFTKNMIIKYLKYKNKYLNLQSQKNIIL